MSSFASIETEVDHLERLPIAEARARFSERVDRALGVGDGMVDKFALDFNARLATRLRERGVPLWGQT